MEILGVSESSLRLGVFLGLLTLLMGAEAIWPRKRLRIGRGRWPVNIAILAIGSVLVRLMAAISVPLVAVGATVMAQREGWGFFNVVAWPSWLEWVLAVVILDALLWAQHWATHRVAFLWRFHRVHHADQDFDVTTALRFHPIEIAASMLLKVLAVVILGPSAVAVIVFEILLNGCSMFNHANLKLPIAFDRVLRKLIVTPDMHRVHHSVHASEHNRNFGFNLAVWDRWFGTYADQPRDGHEGMQIGLPDYQTAGPERLGWSLLLPARSIAKPAE